MRSFNNDPFLGREEQHTANTHIAHALQQILELDDLPEEFASACAEVIYDKGPAIRESLLESPPERQRELADVLQLIDNVHIS